MKRLWDVLNIAGKSIYYGFIGLVVVGSILYSIAWLLRAPAKYEPGDCVQQISDGSMIVRITSANRSAEYSFQYWDELEKAWRPSTVDGETVFNNGKLYVKIVCPFSDKRFPK